MHVIQNLFEPNYFFSSALKVPPSDFIQNMFQGKCLEQGIKVDILDYFKNASYHLKILFVLGVNEYLERLEGKIRKCLFFYVKIL